MKLSRRPGPLSKSMEIPFTPALVPAYSIRKHRTSIGRPFAVDGDLKMPHPSATLPVGLALLGEGLRPLDRVLAARHGDEGRVVLAVHRPFERRHVERAHHHLLGGAHRHR